MVLNPFKSCMLTSIACLLKSCTSVQRAYSCVNSVMICSKKYLLLYLLLWTLYMIEILDNLQRIICMYHCIEYVIAKNVSGTLGPTSGISLSKIHPCAPIGSLKNIVRALLNECSLSDVLFRHCVTICIRWSCVLFHCSSVQMIEYE